MHLMSISQCFLMPSRRFSFHHLKMYKICIILSMFEILLSIRHVEARLHTNEFAVHIQGGEDMAEEIAKKYGFVNKGQIGSLKDYYLFEHHSIQKRSLSPSLAHFEILQNDSSVLWFEQQQVKRRVKRSVETFQDPLYPEQWFLHGGGYGGYDMNVIPAWRDGFTGKGVVISILDDGIQSNHPDLAQNYDKDASYDINGSDDDPTPQDDDDNKHGTRCAGEVAAVANNEFCGVGVAYNSSIGGVRMLDGSVTDTIEATALSLNPDHIHIYSASWGPEDDGKTVDGPGKLAKTAFKEGITKGRGGLGSIFVWASGNGGRHDDNCNCDGYTNSIYTISVSSATQSGLMPWYLEQCSSTLATTYSSGTTNKDQNVVTVDVDYSYFTELQRGQKPVTSQLCTRSHTGTSASAPIAAGICALALEANPQLTWRDMQYLIVMTSRHEPLKKENGWIVNGVGRKVSTKFGYGLMDATAMVKLAKKWKTLPDQHICTTPLDNTERLIPANRGERLETSIKTTGCKNTENAVIYLEHVQVIISLFFRPRGNLHITLISPSGTRSTVLLPRPQDKIDGSFNNWPFMSVHFWGEILEGNWKLVIVNDGNLVTNGPGKLMNWYLVFYGTEERPLYLKSFKDSEAEKLHESVAERAYPVRGVTSYSEKIVKHCVERNQFKILVNGQKECTSKCPVGMYGDLSDYTCHMCDKSCSSCYGPSYNNCLSCSKHFLSNNMCLKTCPGGFLPDTEKRQCIPCLPVCSECELIELCTACHSGLFLYNQNCVPLCPDGTYAHKQTCQECHSSCASCYGSLPTNCIKCAAPHVLYNGSCYSQCPLHYYSNADNMCVRCHRSCEHCLDSDSCTKCRSNWESNSGGNCVYYSNCAGESCGACNIYCDQCSGPNIQDCVYCDSRYVWHEGSCLEQCPDGYFNSENDCIPCEEHCSKCKNTKNCLSCKDGFVLHSGRCYHSCPAGYYDNGKKECDSCHRECHHCTGGSSSNCTSCPVGNFLVHNNCEPQCPSGFFFNMNAEEYHCSPCYSTCKTCLDFGPSHCSSCYDNSSFIDSTCIPCLDGEFFNKVSKKCERCHDNCGRCFGPEENNCLSCPTLLRLDKVKHICLPCCHGTVLKKSECCTCSKDLDVCVNSDHPRSIVVNLSPQDYDEVVIPLRHIVPIVVVICFSVVLLYVFVFGLLQINSMGMCNFSFGGQKYERVPNNMASKFDSEMEKISLTRDDLEDEDDIYEKA